MKPAAWVAVLTFSLVSARAWCAPIVELIPTNPGPYSGGEQLAVDVYLYNPTPASALLEFMRFDFTDTAPGLTLDPVFTFDYGAIPSGLEYYWDSADLPLPWTFMPLACACPEFFIILPARDAVRIGSVGVELPGETGTYRFDVLNRDEPDGRPGIRSVSDKEHRSCARFR